MRLALALIASLALTGSLHAQNCGSYSRSYSYRSYSYPTYSYVQPTYYETPYKTYAPAKAYKEEIVVQKFLAVLPLALLPTYSAAYVPPPVEQQALKAPSTAAAPDAFQKALLDRLDAMDRNLADVSRRLERLERTREPLKLPKKDEEPQPQQQTGTMTFAAANAASCAACHQRGNEAHGGGFVFTEADGKLAKLTAEQRENVEWQITKNRMPKLNSKRAKEMGVAPLTQQSADAIWRALDEQKFAARRKDD